MSDISGGHFGYLFNRNQPSAVLERHIPDNSRALHHPALWAVVVDGVVLGHAVVPERHVVLLPAPADGEFRAGGAGEQQFQNGFALGVRQLVDPCGEAFVDEQ